MEPTRFSSRIVSIWAMQLRVQGNTDNAAEIANWCKGEAKWIYNSETKDMAVSVLIDTRNGFTATVNDWVVYDQTTNEFNKMSDGVFRAKYDTEAVANMMPCEYCLSDPRFTPQGDPDEKLCPICGVRYSGPQRVKEYSVLLSTGLVMEAE